MHECGWSSKLLLCVLCFVCIGVKCCDICLLDVPAEADEEKRVLAKAGP